MYSIIHPWWMSFFSQNLYRAVGQRWRGLGFGYLFLLTIATCLFSTTYSYLKVDRFINAHIPRFVESLPEMKIDANGILSIDKAMPYYMMDPDNQQKTLIVFDTSGKIKSSQEVENAILVTDKQIMIPNPFTKKTKILNFVDYPKIKNITFSHVHVLQVLQQKVPTYLKFTFLLLYVFTVAIFFIVYCISGLLIATFTYLFANKLAGRNNFDFVVRNTMIAMTPVIVIDTILKLANQPQLPILVCVLLTTLYAFVGLAANKKLLPPEAIAK